MNAINTLSKVILFFVFLLLHTDSFAYLHPAELHIENSSQRQLTVKIMTMSGRKYNIVAIGSHSTKAINIHQTGNYYLKIKATYPNRRTVFKKGNQFEVYVGNDGYSVLTISFSIQESELSDPMSGEQISESEFDRDSE